MLNGVTIAVIVLVQVCIY